MCVCVCVCVCIYIYTYIYIRLSLFFSRLSLCVRAFSHSTAVYLLPFSLDLSMCLYCACVAGGGVACRGVLWRAEAAVWLWFVRVWVWYLSLAVVFRILISIYISLCRCKRNCVLRAYPWWLAGGQACVVWVCGFGPARLSLCLCLWKKILDLRRLVHVHGWHGEDFVLFL